MSVQYLRGPLGLLRLSAQDGALYEIAPVETAGEESPDTATREAARQLEEYFAGKRKEFTLVLAPQGTAFKKDVWAALARVPYGSVVTYAQLAAAAGRPAACRAAANAVGKNPLLIVLPCHRVVASNGLGGFSAGLDRKRWLLHREQVDFSEKRRFEQKYFFTFP